MQKEVDTQLSKIYGQYSNKLDCSHIGEMYDFNSDKLCLFSNNEDFKHYTIKKLNGINLKQNVVHYIDEDSERWYYCIPITDVIYSINTVPFERIEQINFCIDCFLYIKDKITNNIKHKLVTGWVFDDEKQLKGIVLDNNYYSMQELFDRYEYLDNDEYRMFGVKK